MMGAQLHLAINHAPLFGIFFGLILLILGRIQKNSGMITGAFYVLFLAGVFGLLAYLTGEGAEEAVEGLPGISHELIEAHEEAALWALIASIALAGVCLAGIILGRKSTMIWPGFQNAALILGLVTLILVGWTASRGGKINHPELRGEGTALRTRPDGQEAPLARHLAPEVSRDHHRR